MECDFVFDDHLAVRNNDDVSHHNKSILDNDGLIYHDFWGKNLKDEASHKSYRPVTVLSFRLNHWISEFNAKPYHLVNMLLHSLVCIFSYFLALAIFKPTHPEEETHSIALLSALIFAAHPVHVEAVTGVVGRAELLGGCFSIMSFLLGIRMIHQKLYVSLLSTFLLTITIFLGCLSKETAITVIPLILMYHFLKILFRCLEAPKIQFCQILKEFVPLFLRTLYMAGIVIGYFGMRVYLMSNSFSLADATLEKSLLVRRTENPIAFTQGFTKFLSINYIQAYNARLLLYPKDLSAEYSYNCIPMVESITDYRNAAPILLYITLLLITSFSLYKKSSAHLLSLAWIVFPYLPASHLLKIGTLIAERTLYLPSLGYSFLLAWCFIKIPILLEAKKTKKSRLGWKAIGIGLFVVLLAWLAMGTYERAQEWKTDESLFASAVLSCPNSAKMHQQLGQVFENTGRMKEAQKEYERAREIDPDWCDLDYCFARIYITKNDYGNAVALLKKNLHCIYTSMKSYPILMEIYKIYFDHFKQNSTTHAEYAEILQLVGANSVAAVHYREAGVIALNAKQYKAAKEYFSLTEKVEPRMCDVHYWRGKLYVATNNLKQAAKWFIKGITCQGLEADKANTACANELYSLMSTNQEIFRDEWEDMMDVLRTFLSKSQNN
uniref:dolichyl-phosphate-mannose--protein mannosyltransferase n=1 Tax=Arcella intermedia TaxID=1963864 RepID=A0A6B2KZ34_9EUKA